MGLLENKIAIVTGAGRGIGKATAHQYSQEGATVIIAEFDEQSGQETANSIGGHFFKADISSQNSVTSLFKYVKKKFNRLNILVNNAGILNDSTLKKMEPDQFDSVMNVNLRGTYLCGKAAANIMIEQKSGVILNAASVVAHNGNFGQTNYVASKTGVIGMTKVWARELGKDGIRVNAIAPGFIQTDMTANMPEKIIRMMGDKVPLRRWGKPEEVAKLVYSLIRRSNLNFNNIAIDGGKIKRLKTHV